jgi:hypothetical protein
MEARAPLTNVSRMAPQTNPTFAFNQNTPQGFDAGMAYLLASCVNLAVEAYS